MKINTPISWTAFLLALSTLNLAAVAPTQAAVEAPPVTDISLEDRLSRIAEVLRMREQHLPQPNPNELAGWANGRGGGGFVNTRGPGWGNVSGGGSFVNSSPFRNGWSDGGSFLNRR